jgi:hypothetical protein
MLQKFFIVSIIVLTAISTSFAGSELNMQEGKWEITTQMRVPGMPVNMPPMKNTQIQCLTKKDFVPQSSQPGQECKITEKKIVGSTVTWTMICKNPGGVMKGTGKVTYKGDTFEGTMKMLMPQQDNMEVTSHVSGRRTGSCK